MELHAVGGSIFDSLFSVGHEDRTDKEPNGPGGGSPELRRQLLIPGDFLQKLPLEDVAPDIHTVTHVAGVYARVLYTPRGNTACISTVVAPAK